LSNVLLIVHLFVTLALIGVVLIQRSEGGGLGIGSSQGMGSFMSGRGTANLLTRTTAILATAFFLLSIGLGLLYKGASVDTSAAILNPAPTAPIPGAPTPGGPGPGGVPPLPQTPADALPQPTAPAVPVPGVPAPPAKGQ